MSQNDFASAKRLAVAMLCALPSLTSGTGRAGPTALSSDRPTLVDELLSSLRGVGGMEAHFREEKRMALLRSPLVSEGQLYFLAPDRLARQVTSPSPATMVVTSTTLSFHDGAHRTEALSLDGAPVVRLFVESFLKILAGDAVALHQIYEITATSSPDGGWNLRLKPRVPTLKRLIDEIELSGRGPTLERLRVLEVGGDETVTVFTKVDIHRRFGAEEERRLFTIGPQ